MHRSYHPGDVWGVSELRRRLLITLLILAIYRLAAHIPIPGFTPAQLSALQGSPLAKGSAFAVANLFTGGAAAAFSVVALGVFPLFQARALMQTAIELLPALQEMRRSPYEARKLNAWVDYLVPPVALVQAVMGELVLLPAMGFTRESWLGSLTAVLALTAGAMVVIWLSRLIDENGVGNGPSMILFAGIVTETPFLIWNHVQGSPRAGLVLALVALVLLVVSIVMQNGQRRIPVEYVRRMRPMGVGTHGRARTYLPLRVLPPDISAMETAYSLLPLGGLLMLLLPDSPLTASIAAAVEQPLTTALIVFGLVVFLSWGQLANPTRMEEIAEDLKRQGGMVPGVRYGEQTARYLHQVNLRIALPGVLYVAAYSVLPWLLMPAMGVSEPVYVVLAVPVAASFVIELMRQTEAELIIRSY
ncbi:MAG: preprotein translocase subunit SecY [Anaerolineae bacterium]